MENFPFMQTYQWHLASWLLYHRTQAVCWSSKLYFFFLLPHFQEIHTQRFLYQFQKRKNLKQLNTLHMCSSTGCWWTPGPPCASLSHATRAYLSFADDKEGVPSCTLPDDIFPIFIVGLKNRNRNRKKLRKK